MQLLIYLHSAQLTKSMAGGMLQILIPSRLDCHLRSQLDNDDPATTDLDELTLYANVTVTVDARWSTEMTRLCLYTRRQILDSRTVPEAVPTDDSGSWI